MGTHTDEEFKEILKRLFAEKKRVQELAQEHERARDEVATLEEELGQLGASYEGVQRTERELKERVAELEEEIQNLRLHMAKKLKENTLMHELIDQQKEQLARVEEE